MKDAYYFSHDSNAKDDVKIMLLIDQLGLEGYGIYWVLIETLRDQDDYKYPVNLLPILARRYNTSGEKMLTVVKKYGLFEIDKNNYFFSLSFNRRMDKMEKIREQRSRAGIESGKSRRRLKETNDEQMFNNSSTNDEQLKESKVNESKLKKTKSEEKEEEKFNPLNILQSIPDYVYETYNEKTTIDRINLISKELLSETSLLTACRVTHRMPELTTSEIKEFLNKILMSKECYQSLTEIRKHLSNTLRKKYNHTQKI